MSSSKQIRLNKAIASTGYTSRRKAENLIINGQVKVNGELVTELGTKVLPNDQITINGKLITKEENKIYYLLNKPRGFVSTVEDQFERKTVLDLIDDNRRIYPVGRLDMDTTGALILTNDGDFTHLLTHPSYDVPKTYRVSVDGELTHDIINALKSGLEIDGTYYKPMHIKRIKYIKNRDRTSFDLVLEEGKNRQIRKLMDHFNIPVIRLHRFAIGDVILDDLKIGEYRRLKPHEVKTLVRQAQGEI